MFVGGDLFGQLMLLDTPRVARSLCRPRGILANLVIKVFGHDLIRRVVNDASLSLYLPGWLTGWLAIGQEFEQIFDYSMLSRGDEKGPATGVYQALRHAPLLAKCIISR